MATPDCKIYGYPILQAIWLPRIASYMGTPACKLYDHLRLQTTRLPQIASYLRIQAIWLPNIARESRDLYPAGRTTKQKMKLSTSGSHSIIYSTIKYG